MKWEKGKYYRLVSTDKRFYVEDHFDEEPGYYFLVDTKTGHAERGAKLQDLKARAEVIVSEELPAAKIPVVEPRRHGNGGCGSGY